MTHLITQRAELRSTGHMQLQSMPVAAGNASVISSLMKWIICRIRLMFCAEEAECAHDLTNLEAISDEKANKDAD